MTTDVYRPYPVTLTMGTTYKARLGMFEKMASDAKIKSTAIAKLEEAGFIKITVWHDGGEWYAMGTWHGVDCVSQRIDDHVLEVWECVP